MKALSIDMTLFLMTFDPDVDYENPAQFAYLDIVSGSVVWFFEEDEVWFFEEDEDVEMYGLDTEENAAQRNRIGCDPGRFLLIPGLSHGEHHDILKSFLASRWTDDDRRRTFAQHWLNWPLEDEITDQNTIQQAY